MCTELGNPVTRNGGVSLIAAGLLHLVCQAESSRFASLRPYTVNKYGINVRTRGNHSALGNFNRFAAVLALAAEVLDLPLVDTDLFLDRAFHKCLLGEDLGTARNGHSPYEKFTALTATSFGTTVVTAAIVTAAIAASVVAAVGADPFAFTAALPAGAWYTEIFAFASKAIDFDFFLFTHQPAHLLAAAVAPAATALGVSLLSDKAGEYQYRQCRQDFVRKTHFKSLRI